MRAVTPTLVLLATAPALSGQSPIGERVPPPVAAPPARAIAAGQSVAGQLSRGDVLRTSDSTYAQAWTIRGQAGQTVTIDLQSRGFDAFLYLLGPGIDGSLQDDDSGGNCDARLTATWPQTGDYTIVVNTRNKLETGPFTLTVTDRSKPKALTRCSRTP